MGSWRVRRHAHRRAIVDAARLMGYVIATAPEVKDAPPGLDNNKFSYVLRTPSGAWYRNNNPGADTNMWKIKTFQFKWQAAAEACTIESVDVDALKPPRETRASRCAQAKVLVEGDRRQGTDEGAAGAAPDAGRNGGDRQGSDT